MNRKELLPVVTVISAFLLAGCRADIPVQTTETDFTTVSADTTETSMGTTGLSQSTTSATATTAMQRTNTNRTAKGKISAGTDKATEMKAYKNVLQNKAEFCSTDENKQVTLNNFNYYGGGNSNDLKVTRFAIVDMDGDKMPEVVLGLGIIGSDGTVVDNYIGFEVLHYEDGIVYGYNFVYRGMESLKTDGTFGYSNSCDDDGFEKLRFLSDKYEEDILGYQEPSKEKNSDGYPIETYCINNKPVSEKSWDSLWDKQKEKKDVVWYELTDANIEKQFTVKS